MEQYRKTAIILGATGLTGRFLLRLLIKDDRYKKVVLFSRSKTEIKDAKIEEHLVDVLHLEKYKTDFIADEVFCCVGTTKSKTPDKKKYHSIDYGIPITAAKLCKENGIGTFIVISAMGANSDSSIFYNQVKGEMENDLLKLQIPKTHILRPSLIVGNRNKRRTGEWLAKQIFKVLNFFLIGPLKNYRSIHSKVIARTMVFLANCDIEKLIIQSNEIKTISSGD
ncbi:NAD(P)H-binding protein [Costertonia aggregata]|uniref:NAD(P)H-binding protein n=1 Tax=Costertonia aggregata TaxID=343403 RepID=A0A7H9AQ17_9FLAO|nr:NAD(P)H-binding protein [Costertonia aggregata]QLG45493.1 NAD(P)H-binding protein [Costertonia aggregata]